MNNMNIVLIVIFAIGAWLLFSDQIKEIWAKLQTKAKEVVVPSTDQKNVLVEEEPTTFVRIRALIYAAERAEQLGVPKAGVELRQAAAQELLNQNEKTTK